MKKKLLLVIAALLAIGQNAIAYDFSAVAPSGQTLYYKYYNGGVSVTYPGSDYTNPYSGYDGPSGALTIPSSVSDGNSTYSITSIDNYAFKSCHGLITVTIPSSVTNIGHYAFCLCESLTSVFIPNSVTSIGESAFGGCASLTSVTIPDSVTIIGMEAFHGCTSLISVNIPNSALGPYAFAYCTSLTSITFHDSITYIGFGTFMGCTALTSIIIPNSVTFIDYGAFCGCSGLTTLAIPNSVTTIEAAAFSGCTGLRSVSIPNSVTTIGAAAFNGCTGLKSVSIPNSVTSIGDNAFRNVRHIEYYGTATGSPWGANVMNGNIDGDFVYADSTKQRLLVYIGNGGDVTIPSTVNIIGDKAFYYCTELTSVTIPNSVTRILDSAFARCTDLLSVSIPNSVTTIGYAAFQSCTSLPTITIPESVISIIEKAFGSCTGLTTVYFNAINCSTGIRQSNSNSYFHNCSNLNTIIIGNNVQRIPEYAFRDCTRLTTITIPDSVTRIGSYAFSGCTGLTSVSIGNSVTRIDYRAFSDCSGLTSFTIPDSITTIGSNAFSGCNHLVNFISHAVYPPSCGNDVFSQVPAYCTLTVPCGSLIYYSVTSPWNTSFPIMNEDCREEFVVTVVSADLTMGSATVNGATTATVLDGDEVTLVATANDGYRFVRWNDNDTHDVRTVTVTADVTYTAYFESTQGIHEVVNNMITVYPNPTNGVVKVDSDDVTRIDVYNVNWQLVKSVSRNSVIDISNLPTGVYTLRVVTVQSTFVCSVIKQ